MRAASIVRRSPPVVLLALAAGVAAVRPLVELGRVHPDEVFQFLEPAHRVVSGYGLVAWEWQEGLRSWAIPGALAGVLGLARTLGARDPMFARAAIAVLMFALHLAMLLAVYRYAARRVGRDGALGAALAIGLYEPVLDLAGRTMSETFSTVFLVWALERLDVRAPSVLSRAIAGGALLGLAFAARYGAGAALVGVGAWLLAFGGARRVLGAIVGGAATLLAVGFLDRLTWGGWFHSFIEYTSYNLLSGAAEERFGASGWSFYLPLVLSASAPFVWVGLVGRRERSLLSDAFFVTSIAYLAITSAAAHKEERFAYGALVMLSIAGATWCLEWARGSGTRAPALVGGALVVSSLVHAALWTSAYPAQATGEIRLSPLAGRECENLVFVGADPWSTGGHFYLGADIPLRYVSGTASVREGDACALVFASRATDRSPRGFRLRAQEDGARLFVRDGAP